MNVVAVYFTPAISIHAQSISTHFAKFSERELINLSRQASLTRDSRVQF